jgi:hypothetical protein
MLVAAGRDFLLPWRTMATKTHIHTFPTNEQIEMAYKCYGQKKTIDYLNELERIRDTIKLIARKGNEEAFTMIDPLVEKYKKIYENFCL